jgi:hypothetical protein
MICGANSMNTRHAGSSVLLAAGLVLVFVGLSSTLGFSLAGTLASAAAIIALLYAGGLWFGAAPHADSFPVVFTRTLIAANGPLAGRPIVELFPDAMRDDIERVCRDALDGRPSKVVCGSGTDVRHFEAMPVITSDGGVCYGLLLSDAFLVSVTSAEQTSVV